MSAEKDAYKQLDELRERFTKEWALREDLTVTADALERRVFVGDVQHNVGTIREFCWILEAACDFVDASNPEWASHHVRSNDPDCYLVTEDNPYPARWDNPKVRHLWSDSTEAAS